MVSCSSVMTDTPGGSNRPIDSGAAKYSIAGVEDGGLPSGYAATWVV
jgi:hypothetical protein